MKNIQTVLSCLNNENKYHHTHIASICDITTVWTRVYVCSTRGSISGYSRGFFVVVMVSLHVSNHNRQRIRRGLQRDLA